MTFKNKFLFCNLPFKNYPGLFPPCFLFLLTDFVERKRSAFDDRSCSIIHLEFFDCTAKNEVESIVSQ